MDTSLIISKTDIQPMTKEQKSIVKQATNLFKQVDQVDLATIHTIHGGVYTRTILLSKGLVLTSIEIEIPTTLVITGHATVYIGSNVTEIKGYKVLTASKGRQQIIYAKEDTYITMVFPTEAKTVEEAEEQFTSKAEELMSRKDNAINIIQITGE